MALIVLALIEIMRKPTLGGVLSELAFFATPLWVAVFVGLLVGWAWRPGWATGLVGGEKLNHKESKDALSGLQLVVPRLDSPSQENENLAVKLEDFQNLFALVETTDGGPAWIPMMNKSSSTMSYQAWRRDPQRGPPQYRSRTIFDDAKPETVRDFFWDDEFRMKNRWDDMLLFHESLKECPVTGTMVVHWIRKFPFFCSDREYTIGRRIWEVDGAYYCVTKGVPLSSIPRRNKPRRVDLYYSSWCIRPVESRRGDGQLTACEVLLFHYEDMGIPWEIAKLGVRQGMWGCVKKIEPGLRAYQAARKSGEPLSRCSLMAHINTKVTYGCLKSLGHRHDQSDDIVEADEKKSLGSNMSKLVLVGGALALVCTVDRGLITKAIIFGVARGFAKIGRRL